MRVIDGRVSRACRPAALRLMLAATVLAANGCTETSCPTGAVLVNGNCTTPNDLTGTDGAVTDGGPAADSDGGDAGPDAPSGSGGRGAAGTLATSGSGGMSGGAGTAGSAGMSAACQAGDLRCDAAGVHVEICTSAGSGPAQECASICVDAQCQGTAVRTRSARLDRLRRRGSAMGSWAPARHCVRRTDRVSAPASAARHARCPAAASSRPRSATRAEPGSRAAPAEPCSSGRAAALPPGTRRCDRTRRRSCAVEMARGSPRPSASFCAAAKASAVASVGPASAAQRVRHPDLCSMLGELEPHRRALCLRGRKAMQRVNASRSEGLRTAKCPHVRSGHLGRGARMQRVGVPVGSCGGRAPDGWARGNEPTPELCSASGTWTAQTRCPKCATASGACTGVSLAGVRARATTRFGRPPGRWSGYTHAGVPAHERGRDGHFRGRACAARAARRCGMCPGSNRCWTSRWAASMLAGCEWRNARAGR